MTRGLPWVVGAALATTLALLMATESSLWQPGHARAFWILATLTAALAVAAVIALRAAMRRQSRFNAELRRQIDERALIQQRLLQSQHRLQLLLDNLPDAVLSFSAAGLVQWINPAARLLFQCTTADAVGQPVATLIPDIAKALPAPTLRRLELPGRRADGSEIELELAVVETPAEGQRSGLCVCRDVSDVHRIERMKHEFVTMVSHELRTPLTSLRGSLALLADGAAGHFEPAAQRLLTLARDNSERLVHLVNDILDFERMRAGGLMLDYEPLELAVVAREALDAMEGMAQHAGVELQLLASDIALPVVADARRLVQVLVNLLSNAIKYSPHKGLVLVQLQARDERARLIVTDQGPGVPAEFTGRLFEPFSQASDPSQRKRGGTGLGLAISRGLMDLMHGSIGVMPFAPGRGASFWIELPRRDVRPSTLGELDDGR
jgi:PAS domain S-box-containing protein